MKGAIGGVLVRVGQVASLRVVAIAVAVVQEHALEDVKEHVQIHVMLEVEEDGNSRLTMKSIKDYKSFQEKKTTKGITLWVL